MNAHDGASRVASVSDIKGVVCVVVETGEGDDKDIVDSTATLRDSSRTGPPSRSSTMERGDVSLRRRAPRATASHDVLGSLVKLFWATLGMLALSCAFAGVLSVYEAPLEKAMRARRRESIASVTKIITEMFGFIDDPLTRGLEVDDNAPSCRETYRGYTLPEVTEHGKTFAGGIDMIIIPQNLPGAQVPEIYKFSDAVRCAGPMGGTCRLNCILEKPSVKQVEACRSREPSALNPTRFDDDCLRSSKDCPNCHILRRRVNGLEYWAFAPEQDLKVDSVPVLQADDLDPNGERFMQAAELYVLYKTRQEAKIPAVNWNFSGAFYFAFTVFTTVGYGTYQPVTMASKLCLIVFIIPAICLFGFAFAQLSEIMLGIMMWALRALGLAKIRMKIETSPRQWAKMLRKIDANNDGVLTLKEILSGTQEMFCSLGLIDAINASSRTLASKQHWNKIPRENLTLTDTNIISAMFEEEDFDGSGEIDMMQGMVLISKLVKLYEAKEDELQAREELVAALCIFSPLLVAAALGFQALEKHKGFHYSILDTFYFCIVSFTTVGLGDIAPSHGPSEMYWYAYMILSLGTLASIISSITTILISKRKQSLIWTAYKSASRQTLARPSLHHR